MIGGGREQPDGQDGAVFGNAFIPLTADSASTPKVAMASEKKKVRMVDQEEGSS